MKEIPIIFCTKMIEAIHAGRKTRTRRIADEADPEKSPWGKVGDKLWVRESFAYIDDFTGADPGAWALMEKGFFRADYGDIDNIHDSLKRWRPSIHMPKELCRTKLVIVDLAREKLQEISPKDIKEEGTPGMVCGRYQCPTCNGQGHSLTYPKCPECEGTGDNPRYWFRKLWRSLHSKPKPRKRNPFTKEQEECFVSYPWKSGRIVKKHRGKWWYVIGNPSVWNIGFSVDGGE